MAVMPTPVVENKTEDEYYPEPTVEVVPEPQIQQPPQAIEEDDWGDDEDEDDWDDDEDDWGDDEDDVQTLELKPVQSEEEDPWEDEFEDEDDEDEDDEEDFDGIVTGLRWLMALQRSRCLRWHPIPERALGQMEEAPLWCVRSVRHRKNHS